MCILGLVITSLGEDFSLSETQTLFKTLYTDKLYIDDLLRNGIIRKFWIYYNIQGRVR